MTPELKDLLVRLKQDCFIIVDGGARNGTAEVPRLHPLSMIFAFEPNKEEFLKLKETSGQDSLQPGAVLNYPVALTKEDGDVILNVSLRPGATSVLYPNSELLDHFKEDHWSELRFINQQVTVPGMRLKTFMKKTGLQHIDLLKLDTQGNELDILTAAEEWLDKIEVIKVEVEFIPIYKNQPLFYDVGQFLTAHGFELINIEFSDPCRRFHARPDLGVDAYRLVWADAVFARRPYDFQKPRLLFQAVILGEMGYRDLAIYQIKNHPSLLEPEKQLFEQQYSRRPAQTLSAKINNQLMSNMGIRIKRCQRGQQIASKRSG